MNDIPDPLRLTRLRLEPPPIGGRSRWADPPYDDMGRRRSAWSAGNFSGVLLTRQFPESVFGIARQSIVARISLQSNSDLEVSANIVYSV